MELFLWITGFALSQHTFGVHLTRGVILLLKSNVLPSSAELAMPHADVYYLETPTSLPSSPFPDILSHGSIVAGNHAVLTCAIRCRRNLCTLRHSISTTASFLGSESAVQGMEVTCLWPHSLNVVESDSRICASNPALSFFVHLFPGLWDIGEKKAGLGKGERITWRCWPHSLCSQRPLSLPTCGAWQRRFRVLIKLGSSDQVLNVWGRRLHEASGVLTLLSTSVGVERKGERETTQGPVLPVCQSPGELALWSSQVRRGAHYWCPHWALCPEACGEPGPRGAASYSWQGD